MGTRPGKERIELRSGNMHGLGNMYMVSRQNIYREE